MTDETKKLMCIIKGSMLNLLKATDEYDSSCEYNWYIDDTIEKIECVPSKKED